MENSIEQEKLKNYKSVLDCKNMLVRQGKPIMLFSDSGSKKLTLNDITNICEIKKDSVTLQIKNYSDLKVCISINTHKLLSTAIAEFTRNNDYSKKEKFNCRVHIPLREYAIKLGYTVKPQNNTKEEIKRVKNILDNVRKNIKKNLELLSLISINWEGKGKNKDFLISRVISGYGIKSGYIILDFSYSMAEMIMAMPITYYPTALMKIDARNPNSYSMAEMMSHYYNISSNVKRGTNNRLRVETLLKRTNLPTYEEVLKNGRGWRERIKQPFENALDELVFCGVMKDWKYGCYAGGELNDVFREEIEDYKIFSSLLVVFTPLDTVDHSDLFTKNSKKHEG